MYSTLKEMDLEIDVLLSVKKQLCSPYITHSFYKTHTIFLILTPFVENDLLEVWIVIIYIYIYIYIYFEHINGSLCQMGDSVNEKYG